MALKQLLNIYVNSRKVVEQAFVLSAQFLEKKYWKEKSMNVADVIIVISGCL